MGRTQMQMTEAVLVQVNDLITQNGGGEAWMDQNQRKVQHKQTSPERSRKESKVQ